MTCSNFIEVNAALFPFADYWWLYLAFTGLVVVLLAIDLAFHRKERPISFRNAATWTAVWISLALAFSYALYLFTAARHSPAIGRQLSLEFLAGYVVEESLSVDNMFVFVLVFRYFAVPLRYQHKVLFYGVLGAMVFRGIFIAAGTALVRFEWIMILFGLFLIFTGIRMAVQKEQQINPDDSLVIRWMRRFFPVTGEFHGSRFLVTIERHPPHHAADGGAALPRNHRPALRRGFGAGGLRRHARTLRGLHLQRVRRARASGDVLPAWPAQWIASTH